MQHSTMSSAIKREARSRDSSPPPQSETSLPPPEMPVPSFVQAPSGGLVAGSVVLAGTVFGPYKGSIRKVLQRKEDGHKEAEPTGLKFHDSADQVYVVDVDRTETEAPWWACIKRTTEQSRANVTLFSLNGALYIKTLTEIPKAKELLMILTTPKDGTGRMQDDGAEAMSRITTPVTTTPPHPANSLALEGPPFKCSFCCIEFRNPSNLDAHRVYYCPGTATKPLPSARRRSTTTTQSTVTNKSSVQAAPVHETKCPEVPAAEFPKTFVCQLCQSSFESNSNCESHMLLLHCDESANLCKFCNFISGDRKGLCQHVFSHVRGTWAEEAAKSPGNGGKQVQGTASKIAEDGLADDGDEKENRYEVTGTASKCRNKLQNNGTVVALLSGTRHVASSPGDSKTSPVSNASSADTIVSLLTKEERCSPATLTKAVSPNGMDPHSMAVAVNREPVEEDILRCDQCDFVTSRESILLKHMTHHSSLRKKTPVHKMDMREDMPDHADTTCQQCNIVFMSKKNYMAHKQYYCASRHADSGSPSAGRDWETKSRKSLSEDSSDTRLVTPEKMDRNTARKTLNGSDHLREPCPSKLVSPRCSPFGVDEKGMDNSPRTGSFHRTLRLSNTPPLPLVSPTTRSSPGGRAPFNRPVSMIHLDGAKPQFFPPGAVLQGPQLQGPQLVLVTPIIIPQNLSSAVKLDSNLKIPVIRNSRVDQPLDLSTKPKTPPLSDPSESDHHKTSVVSPGLLSQNAGVQWQPNRCEECEISFSKKESLVVHKQYYCASRHIFTPRGLVRTKQYNSTTLPTMSNSQLRNKSPRPDHLAERSIHSDMKPGFSKTCNSQTKLKRDGLSCSPTFSNSSTMGSDTPNPQTTGQESQLTNTCTSVPLLNGNTSCKDPNSSNINNRHSNLSQNSSWTVIRKLKRAASNESSESDKERSLPLIKRKRNLIPDEETRKLPTVTVNNGSLTNGVIVKQEPQGKDYVVNSNTCIYSRASPNSKLIHHRSEKSPEMSTSLPPPHRRAPITTQTVTVIKQEPRDEYPASNGHFRESPELVPTVNRSRHSSVSLQSHCSTSPTDRPDFTPSPALIRHPIPTSPSLTIPVYRHSSSRQPTPSRHMTVSAYLNTGTSRPLLRGVKPMVKHCRNCNISFSSLSTFIAHKKYYCASHNQTKNAAT